MADIVNQIIAFFENLVDTIGYPGIFLVMFAENVFPPVPTDPLMPFAGILAAEGRFTFAGVWASAVAGALVGSMVLYGLGATLGEEAVRVLIRRYGRRIGISEDQLDRSLALFARHGGGFVFVGRAIPVLRSAVSLTAGMSRMPVLKFMFYAGLMSALVTGFWAYAGYTLGQNWESILEGFDRYQPLFIFVGLILVAAGGFWFYRRTTRRKKLAAMSENVPDQTLQND